MKNRIVLLIGLTLMSGSVFAQNKAILKWKAKRAYNMGNYHKSANYYQQFLNKDIDNLDVSETLGILYLDDLQQYDSAYAYLSKAIDQDAPTSSALFHYGRCLRLMEKPQEAIAFFNQFETAYNDDIDSSLSQNLREERKFAQNAITAVAGKDKTTRVNNIGFEVNSINSEYTPVYLESDSTLIYNGRYQDLEKEQQFADNMFMENMYYFNMKESVVSVYDKEIEQKSHFAIVGKSAQKDKYLVYHKNKLWFAHQEAGRIEDIEPLPREISNYYFQPHGTYSPSGDTLVFSAREEITDQLDIFVTVRENNEWSAPSKLGALNTDRDEDSPYFSKDGKTIYFSSKGHGSCGGYDVFKSSLGQDGWEKPISMGYPINSAGDDIYFSVSDNNNFGYLASNRHNGFGLMDLYSVQFKPTPDFDCAPFNTPDLIVDLDITESIDSNSAELKYIWRFEDGSKMEGIRVQKTFDFPGTHVVNLDIIDVESGLIETKELTDTVIIEGVDYVGYASPYQANVNEMIDFDASVSQVSEHQLVGYNWRIGDEVIYTEEGILSKEFSRPGEYTVALQIDALDKKERYKTFCYERVITILDSTVPVDTTSENGELFVDNSDDNGDHVDINKIINLLGENSSLNEENTNDVFELIANKTVDSSSYSPIYFDFDKSNLRDKSEKDLNELIAYMNKNSEYYLIIYGHTDSKGSSSYNKKLAGRRANKTYNYLVTNGISKDRIIRAVGVGEIEPAAPNENPNGTDNSTGRQLNRRVEFILIF